jgi:hypothetical protein
MQSRALHEIESEAYKLVRVQILGKIEDADAAEGVDWSGVLRLAERLKDLAERGIYHQSQQKETAAFALGNHREPEPR